MKSLGADATFCHRVPVEEQLRDIASITEEKFSKVFDASAFAAEVGMKALELHGDSNAKPKLYSTTNDWYVPSNQQASNSLQC